MRERFCRVIENDKGAQFLAEIVMIEGSTKFEVRQVFVCQDVTVELFAGPMTEEKAQEAMAGINAEAIKKILDDPQAAMDALMNATMNSAEPLVVSGPDNPQMN